MLRTSRSEATSIPLWDGADDVTLILAAQSGDRRAFAVLHERHVKIVTSVVRAEARQAADTADIVQEVFASAWTRIRSLRDPHRFRAWLLQIARRQVIDHARAQGRRPRLDADDDGSLELVTAVHASPAEAVELLELAEEIRVALAGLSRRDVTAITLAAQLAFGPAELAAALDLTPNNAKVVLHRARKRLRAALDSSGAEAQGRAARASGDGPVLTAVGG